MLGSGSELEISKDGKQTTARLTFATDINAKAALVWNLIKRGVLRTVSVGFMNHSFEVENDIPILKDNELLEISVDMFYAIGVSLPSPGYAIKNVKLRNVPAVMPEASNPRSAITQPATR